MAPRLALFLCFMADILWDTTGAGSHQRAWMDLGGGACFQIQAHDPSDEGSSPGVVVSALALQRISTPG